MTDQQFNMITLHKCLLFGIDIGPGSRTVMMTIAIIKKSYCTQGQYLLRSLLVLVWVN